MGDLSRTPIDRLSPTDAEVVRECLAAAVDGPFFPDWEFPALLGRERNEVARVLDRWPDRSSPEEQHAAVSSVLTNLLGYPHGQAGAWREYISVPPSEVAAVLARWQGADDVDPSPRG